MPMTSFAEGLVPCDTGASCDFNAFMDLINGLMDFVLFKLAVPIAAIMFAYAGFKMVTSGGSSEARGVAKNVFSSTVIGFVLAATAWIVVKSILSILGYNGAWIFQGF